MTPINNSDTAWLIVSDYNQDNNLPYEDLREDILNPEINSWTDGSNSYNVGACGFTGVGSVGFSSEELRQRLIANNGGVVGYNCDYFDIHDEVGWPSATVGDMYDTH
jgi:hypothetical protein